MGVGVEGEAHLIGGKGVGENLHEVSAVSNLVFVFKCVVVVHELAARIVDLLSGCDRFCEEFVDAVVPAGHGADADVLASEGLVIGDGLFGIVENSVVAEMGDTAGQTGTRINFTVTDDTTVSAKINKICMFCPLLVMKSMYWYRVTIFLLVRHRFICISFRI